MSLKQESKYGGEKRRGETENAGPCQTRFSLIDYSLFCLLSLLAMQVQRVEELYPCHLFTLSLPHCVKLIYFKE